MSKRGRGQRAGKAKVIPVDRGAGPRAIWITGEEFGQIFCRAFADSLAREVVKRSIRLWSRAAQVSLALSIQ